MGLKRYTDDDEVNEFLNGLVLMDQIEEKIKIWKTEKFKLEKTLINFITSNWDGISVTFPDPTKRVEFIKGSFKIRVLIGSTFEWTILPLNSQSIFECEIILNWFNEWLETNLCNKHPLFNDFKMKLRMPMSHKGIQHIKPGLVFTPTIIT